MNTIFLYFITITLYSFFYLLNQCSKIRVSKFFFNFQYYKIIVIIFSCYGTLFKPYIKPILTLFRTNSI